MVQLLIFLRPYFISFRNMFRGNVGQCTFVYSLLVVFLTDKCPACFFNQHVPISKSFRTQAAKMWCWMMRSWTWCWPKYSLSARRSQLTYVHRVFDLLCGWGVPLMFDIFMSFLFQLDVQLNRVSFLMEQLLCHVSSISATNLPTCYRFKEIFDRTCRVAFVCISVLTLCWPLIPNMNIRTGFFICIFCCFVTTHSLSRLKVICGQSQ